ncbi:Sugar lactone lactonase YvrE [Burkholderia sp. GAS332]|nr:Sugar lactone lactonase YvrE [Burkholderia sp. GAS332]
MHGILNFDVEAVASTYDTLGESPVWNEHDQRLYWIDVRRGRLQAFAARTGELDAWDFDGLIGGIALRTDGSIIVTRLSSIDGFAPFVLMDGARGINATDQLVTLARFPDKGSDHRTNEVKCDRVGNLWCGTMRDFGKDSSGALYRIDAAQEPLEVRANVTIPNALDFSPDGKWAYFSDTATGRIDRASFDSERGMVGEWHVLVEAGAAPGKPDGLTIDQDGCLWNARFGGACIARFDPHGRLMGTLALPVSQPTSCAFGGERLNTLFVTSARQWLSDAALAQELSAGALLACETPFTGLAPARYRG